jgi:Protochlamydia outer membrane protein
MKQSWIILGLSLGCSFFSPVCAQASCLEIKDSSYSIGYTYREDRLSWDFAGPADTPNVLSELKWNDVRINQVTFATHLTTCNHLYFRGYADYGRIFHGKNRDSDYDENDRQEEFSRALSEAGRGEVFDLSAGVGYQWSWCCERIRLAPLVGLSWQEQHLRLYDGEQVIPFSEKIEDLHSSYKTRWWGPWVGVDFLGQVNCNFSLFASFEYHWVPYQGKGHWNLRDDIISDFKHESNGRGWVTQGGVNYNICGSWSITLLASYQDWCAKNGTHRIKVLNDELEVVTLKARLNDVNWSSFQASFLVTYSY